MSRPDPLHQLRDLDQSKPEFPNNLTSLLEGQGYRDRVAGLDHDELLWLVEYLEVVSPGAAYPRADFISQVSEQLLDFIPPTDPASRKCLRELRATCGSSGILPRSCTFPEPAPITAEWPIASRGPYDVYEGLLGDTKVSVKRLRMYLYDEQGGHKRVRFWLRQSSPPT